MNSFQVIAQQNSLRYPKTNLEIKNILDEYFELNMEKVKKNLNNKRFYLSVDSTQIRTRRFLSIIVYPLNEKPIILGLIREKKSSTAHYMQTLIQEELSRFGIGL